MSTDQDARPGTPVVPIPHSRPAPEPTPDDLLPPLPDMVADFRRRTTGGLHRLLAEDPDLLAPLHELDAHLSGRERVFGAARDSAVAEHLATAFEIAGKRSGGLVAMACYVHGRCLEAWEASTSWALIGSVVEATAGVAERLAGTDGPEADAARLVLAHTRSLTDAMAVEAGMNCSCPIAMRRHAVRVVDVARATQAALATSRSLTPRLRDYLATVAATDRTYFTAIGHMASAVESALEERESAAVDLAAAAAELAAAECSPDLDDDVYRSELKAHRRALDALGARLGTPRLNVDQGSVTYIYPFSVPHPDAPSEQPDPVTTWVDGAGEPAVTGWTLCGMHPTAVRPLAVSQGLTEFWQGADRRHRYGGVSLFLPPVTVVTNDGQTLDGEVELRLSDLGNHYLRVAVELSGGHPHDLNQALRRSSPQMGYEEVTSEGADRSWRTLHDYAWDVIEEFQLLAPGAAVEPAGDAEVSDEVRPYHVVVSVRALSVVEDGASRSVPGTELTNGDLTGARLFWHPVANSAATLEEWLRYPEPELENLVRDQGTCGDLVLQTSNTTIVAMPDTPSFRVTMFEEAAEFVASLGALLTSWRRLVERSVDDGRRCLDGVSDDEGVDAAARLQLGQETLHTIKSDVQSRLARLKSPAFCKTATGREYLDRLWLAAGLDKDEAALESGIRDAQAVYERYVSRAAALATGRQQRQRNTINGLVTVVGLAGLADLFGLLNDGFDWSVRATGLELVIIAIVVAVVGRLVWKDLRRSGARRAGPRRRRRTGDGRAGGAPPP